jgi:hypothetical protein
LEYGPLGPTNPYKEQMDYLNRQVSSCKDMLVKKTKPIAREGTIFTYKKKKLIVLQIAGKGVWDNSESGKQTYADKMTEFCGKEAALDVVAR